MIPHQLHRENGPYGSLLVGTCPPEGRLLDYQLDLLMRHKPAWLLAAYIRYRHGSAQICLDTSGLCPLDESFPDLGQELAQGHMILTNIARLLLDAADLLLPQGQFSLHPSLIYLDQQKEIRLAFWPWQTSQPAVEQLPDLCVSIGQAFNWPEAKIQAAVAAAKKSPAQLVAWLDQVSQKPEDTENEALAVPVKDKKTSRKSLPGTEKKLFVAAGIILHTIFAAWTGLVILTSLWQRSRPFLLPALLGLAGLDLILYLASRPREAEKTKLFSAKFWQKLRGRLAGPDLSEQDETVILAKGNDFRLAMLSEGQPGTPAEHEGVRAFILVDEFIIGRDTQKADLCLAQQAVGRVHASIQRRAGSFFIRDLGSGNGTDLDGQRLARHEDYLLPDNCLISFAGQEFYFTAD